MKVFTNKLNLSLLTTTALIIMISTAGVAANAYASSFNANDFKSKKFGIYDRLPF